MKVFILTEGQYSDYKIISVVSTEAEAKLIAAALYDVSFEEWLVDGKPLWYGVTVMMDRRGNTKSIKRESRLYELSERPELDVRFTDYDVWSRTYPEDSDLRTIIWAPDGYVSDERAIKIANERRSAILMANLWNQPGEATAMLESHHH
mgnify:FL=1